MASADAARQSLRPETPNASAHPLPIGVFPTEQAIRVEQVTSRAAIEQRNHFVGR